MESKVTYFENIGPHNTALVMQAASSRHMKRLRVNEIICKPLNPLNIDEALAKNS